MDQPQNRRVRRCIELAQAAAADPAAVGALSSGERIIVALLHNKTEWLPPGLPHLLDALDYLDSDWRVALKAAHRVGW